MWVRAFFERAKKVLKNLIALIEGVCWVAVAIVATVGWFLFGEEE